MAEQRSFNWTKLHRERCINELAYVPPNGKASLRNVASVLRAIESHYGDKDHAWPSQVTIARFTKLSTRAVRFAVAWLGRARIVHVEYRWRGDKKTAIYRISWPNLTDYNRDPTQYLNELHLDGVSGKEEIRNGQRGNLGPTKRKIASALKRKAVSYEPPSEPPQEPSFEPPTLRGSREISFGGEGGGPYSLDARKMAYSLQAICGELKPRLSQKDRQIIDDIAEEFAEGRISWDQIKDALKETRIQIRLAVERGSPIGQPVSYFDHVLCRIVDSELAR